MDLWILVYSPINNEHIFKLAYFRHSYEFENFILSNQKSFYVRYFEQVHFELSLDSKNLSKTFHFDDEVK